MPSSISVAVPSAKNDLYSLKDCMGELERFYHFMNGRHGLNLPGHAVITIQTRGRRQGPGWFVPHAWRNHKEPKIHEINLCAEFLQENPYASLAHEMAHFCELKARPGREMKKSACAYHTRIFKGFAQKLGLTVEWADNKGWGMTMPGIGLEKALLEFKPKNEVFDLLRLGHEGSATPTKMKKWTCGCTNVRCAVELAAVCRTCGRKFKRERE